MYFLRLTTRAGYLCLLEIVTWLFVFHTHWNSFHSPRINPRNLEMYCRGSER